MASASSHYHTVYRTRSRSPSSMTSSKTLIRFIHSSIHPFITNLQIKPNKQASCRNPLNLTKTIHQSAPFTYRKKTPQGSLALSLAASPLLHAALSILLSILPVPFFGVVDTTFPFPALPNANQPANAKGETRYHIPP